MDNKVMQTKKIVTYRDQSFRQIEDYIADEFPLTIKVNGEEFATMVCTPTELEELVVGFLASEGLIRMYHDIEAITVDEDRGFAYVDLVKKQAISKDDYSKRFIGSCCGKSRQFYYQNDVRTAKTIMKSTEISTDQCFKLMNMMQQHSKDFKLTGGIHNAALCSSDGMLLIRSDIGRHNALDKIYGHCLKNRIKLSDKILAFSGRISSEVLLKVSKIGVGIILSKSAPTTLAIDLAEDLGITTVGFIRGNSFNVYSHTERIYEGENK
jgi:FdhD protein